MKFRQLFGVTICVIIIHSVHSIPNSTSIIKPSESKNLSRSKRNLPALPIWFPYNTCIALAVVLAIPLTLKNRNVYMAYNFETKFYLPYFDKGQGLVPLPFATIDAPAVDQGTKIFYAQGGQTRNLDGEETNENDSSQDETTTITDASLPESTPDATKFVDDKKATSTTERSNKTSSQPNQKKMNC